MMNPDRERLALEYLEEALGWIRGEREARLHATLSHDPELLAEVRALLATAEAVNDSLPTAIPLTVAIDDLPPPERLGPYRLGGSARQRRHGPRVSWRARRRSVRADHRGEAHAPDAHAAAGGRTVRARAADSRAASASQHRAALRWRRHARGAFVLHHGAGGRADPSPSTPSRTSSALRETLLLFMQVCAAVQLRARASRGACGHQAEQHHRDADGTAKLLDFGVARVIADAGEAVVSRGRAARVSRSTMRALRGARAKRRRTADDVYSLGVLLQELLRRIGVAEEELRSICRRASAEDPATRYVSVDAMRGGCRAMARRRAGRRARHGLALRCRQISRAPSAGRDGQCVRRVVARCSGHCAGRAVRAGRTCEGAGRGALR